MLQTKARTIAEEVQVEKLPSQQWMVGKVFKETLDFVLFLGNQLEQTRRQRKIWKKISGCGEGTLIKKPV